MTGLACCYLGISVSIHTSVHSGLKPEGCVSRFKRDRLRCEQKSWRQPGFHSLSLLDKYSHTHSVFLIFSFLAALDWLHPGAGCQLGEIPMLSLLEISVQRWRWNGQVGETKISTEMVLCPSPSTKTPKQELRLNELRRHKANILFWLGKSSPFSLSSSLHAMTKRMLLSSWVFSHPIFKAQCYI